ncbi:unnamed protein product [Darwinula stevensoni]|uniref:Protein kinase domain-containing protein n=1 Tax=Darwinula stevensoni TaxID=69355 RepID=A0A7R9ACJ4_9CRUS|nr:unnamed protein product [Darwinula stevensoni]CAG0900074.1 unnamed protein product [Darwinula stevensoni]
MAPECLRGEWYNEKADVFSFGIILCEMAARIEADPDVLPRTENFGLDYVALSDMMDPKSRPSFSQLESTLRELLCGDENGTIPSSPVDSPQLALPLPIPITLQSAEENEKLTPGDTSSERSRDAVTPIRLPLGKASPRHISQVMCRLDPHYRPRSSTNPFSTLSFGTGKILATSSNLDLSSLSPSSSSADAPYPLSLLFHSLPNSPTFVRKEEEGAGKERPPEEVEGEACRCRRRGSGESGFFSVEESERVSSSTDLSPDLGLVASASLDSSSEFCDATDTRAQLFERSSSACTDSSEDASCFGEDERTSRQRDVGRIVEYFEHVRGVHEKEKRPKRITVSANVQNLLREARLHRRLPAAATSVVDNLGSTTSPVVTRVIDASSATSKGPSICKGTVKAKLELFNAKQSSRTHDIPLRDIEMSPAAARCFSEKAKDTLKRKILEGEDMGGNSKRIPGPSRQVGKRQQQRYAVAFVAAFMQADGMHQSHNSVYEINEQVSHDDKENSEFLDVTQELVGVDGCGHGSHSVETSDLDGGLLSDWESGQSSSEGRISVGIESEQLHILPLRARLHEWANTYNITLPQLQGLQKIIQNFLKTPELFIVWLADSDMVSVALTINIDGIPLFKSSQQQFWPILCLIRNAKDKIPFPVVIGTYVCVEMWAVVVFDEEEATATVPITWVSEGKCCWPGTKNRTRLIQQSDACSFMAPVSLQSASNLSNNIEFFTVILIDAGDYEEARKLAWKAEKSSDLEQPSDLELNDGETRKSTRIKKTTLPPPPPHPFDATSKHLQQGYSGLHHSFSQSHISSEQHQSSSHFTSPVLHQQDSLLFKSPASYDDGERCKKDGWPLSIPSVTGLSQEDSVLQMNKNFKSEDIFKALSDEFRYAPGHPGGGGWLKEKKEENPDAILLCPHRPIHPF